MFPIYTKIGMPKKFKTFKYEIVTSTNDICFEKCRLNKGANFVISEEQSDGRGRNSKKWFSPKGNISFSFGFFSQNLIKGLSVQSGLIVAKTIQSVFKKDVGLKWPNDLIFRSKKVGGILTECENRDNKYLNVIGIGLNLKIESNESHWGSLEEEIESKKKQHFISHLQNNLLVLTENNIKNNWVAEWEGFCIHINQKIYLKNLEQEAVFLGIDSDGSLIGRKDGKVFRSEESSIFVEGLY